MIEIPFRTGIPLSRWLKGLSVMLLKQAGNLNVDKLRAILLMEADFNFANNLFFGKRLTSSMETTNFLPPDTFARKRQTASDVAVCKALLFDIIRHRKCNAIIGSYDANNCYDRVVHSLTSLMAQALGCEAGPLMCMFGAIQGMCFFLRTAFGDSTTNYRSSTDLPYQGLIQGNGAAPSLWLMVSSYLIWYI